MVRYLLMKIVYVFFVILVLSLGVSLYFLNTMNMADSTTGAVTQVDNKLTGHASQADPLLLKFGDANTCFIYDSACPSDTITLFRVPTDFNNSGGSHIASYNNENFSWRMCCNKIVHSGGDRNFTLFHTSADDMFDAETLWGSHAFDPSSLITRKYADIGMANYIIYSRGECPAGYECAVKVSPLDNNSYNFYNSHIWPCEKEFNTINLTSICYKPENQTDCASYQGPCNYAGISYVDTDPSPLIHMEWTYCSFGKDDEQIPIYPSSEYEVGHCCRPGEYYDNITNACLDSFNCGFSEEELCYLPNTNHLTGEPAGYFEKEYFDQKACVDWDSEESCCFNITKFSQPGNWMCPITSTRI